MKFTLLSFLVVSSAVLSALGAETAPTEVVVIGTQHFITDMPEGYTPAHLRALLAKVAPKILAVEAPAHVEKPWDFAPLELAQVTRPWGTEHGIDVVPVGWFDEAAYNAGLTKMFQEFQAKGRDKAYQELESDFQRFSAQKKQTCEFMNSEASYKLWRDYHAGLHNLYGKQTVWELWNEKITATVLKLCRDHPGERIAVVFGAAHAYYLADYLAQQKGLRVIPASSFFPLAEQEVDEATKDKDYLMSLRLLNFPSVDPSMLPKFEETLKKLKTVAAFQHDYHLFQGKLLLQQQRPKDALEEFAKLVALGDDQISAFDGSSRLCEAGLVYSAIATSKAGEMKKANQQLQAILARAGLSPATKDWVEQLLKELTIKQ